LSQYLNNSNAQLNQFGGHLLRCKTGVDLSRDSFQLQSPRAVLFAIRVGGARFEDLACSLGHSGRARKGAQRRLFRLVESSVRERGHGERIDGWAGELPLLRGETDDG